MKPSVYIGTYWKYNMGSLDGEWVTLTDFKIYKDFVNKCKEIHKDEIDPEFMIQDYECLPDGFSIGEWIDEKDFIEIIKAIEEEDNEKDLEDKCDYIQCKEEYINNCVESDTTKKYYNKSLIGAVKLGSWYYQIEKPIIQNKFCFHDEGPQYDLYTDLIKDDDKMKKYFININLKNFNEQIYEIENFIKKLNKKEISKSDNNVFWIDGRNDNYITFYKYDKNSNGFFNVSETYNRKATQKDCILILNAIKWSKLKFEKRLNTYLKKYGTSKLNIWTYWADK